MFTLLLFLSNVHKTSTIFFWQIAGNHVRKATESLVDSATNKREEVIQVKVSQKKWGGIFQEREAENEVNTAEAELDELRRKLAEHRKQKNKFKGQQRWLFYDGACAQWWHLFFFFPEICLTTLPVKST